MDDVEAGVVERERRVRVEEAVAAERATSARRDAAVARARADLSAAAMELAVLRATNERLERDLRRDRAWTATASAVLAGTRHRASLGPPPGSLAPEDVLALEAGARRSVRHALRGELAGELTQMALDGVSHDLDEASYVARWDLFVASCLDVAREVVRAATL